MTGSTARSLPPIALALILSLTLATLACDSASDSPIGPTAVGTRATLHDTLNELASQRILTLRYSFQSIGSDPLAYDDFVSPITGTIRRIEWQGGYCDPRFQVAAAIPPAVARGFRIGFSEDRNEYPAMLFRGPVLQEFTVTAAEARETLDFSLLSNDLAACGGRSPAPFVYYRYAATLPEPLRVTASQRYWVRIVADPTREDIYWGWRVGTQDNNRSVFEQGGSFNSTFTTDLAFALLP